MTQADTTCPGCQGEMTKFVMAQTTSGHYVGPMACYLCKGWGIITVDLAERIEAAEERKQARRAKDLSLREAAKLEGMSGVEYSRLESPSMEREYNPEAQVEFMAWVAKRKEK